MSVYRKSASLAEKRAEREKLRAARLSAIGKYSANDYDINSSAPVTSPYESAIKRTASERITEVKSEGGVKREPSFTSGYSTNYSPSYPPEKTPTSSSHNARSTRENRRRTGKKDEDCIGFATLPDQIHRKVVKKGFHFTVMVVGESGLGKSTLINSLFMNDLYKERRPLNVEEKFDSTVQVEAQYIDIEEAGVKLRLTIIDTPGFCEALNGEQSIEPVERYIDEQFHQYLEAESGLNRKNIQDSRVHCLLYFISPSGHGLKPIDVECLKRLHTKVNIIPVIAKSDTLTIPELTRFKQKVMRDIEENDIRIYDFPECDDDEDDSFKAQDAELKAAIPFAVIGSNAVTEVKGRRIRARLYPWGIVEVENSSHSDFSKLRRMLIGTHLQDLKDVTEEIHYENYRAHYILQKSTNNNITTKHSEPEVDQLLLEKEMEIKKMQEMLESMQKQMLTAN